MTSCRFISNITKSTNLQKNFSLFTKILDKGSNKKVFQKHPLDFYLDQ